MGRRPGLQNTQIEGQNQRVKNDGQIRKLMLLMFEIQLNILDLPARSKFFALSKLQNRTGSLELNLTSF